jgi:hypothetical protein
MIEFPGIKERGRAALFLAKISNITVFFPCLFWSHHFVTCERMRAGRLCVCARVRRRTLTVKPAFALALKASR